jgi:surface antigen
VTDTTEKAILAGGSSLRGKPAKRTTATRKTSTGLTAEEKAAMRETLRERKSPGGEKEVLAKIAEMQTSDRELAERVHSIVKAVAPDLSPRTWYGMPAYAKDGKVVCFTQVCRTWQRRRSFG